MSDKKRIAGVDYTSAQRTWLRTKAGDIGNTMASVQRDLVQEKIQAEKDIADKAKQFIN